MQEKETNDITEEATSACDTQSSAFGRMLAVMLSDRNITQLDFALKTHTNQSSISAICNGKRQCGIKLATRFADALRLDGREKSHFLANSARPSWMRDTGYGFGAETALNHIEMADLALGGIQSASIGAVTRVGDKKSFEQPSLVYIVLKDGRIIEKETVYRWKK